MKHDAAFQFEERRTFHPAEKGPPLSVSFTFYKDSSGRWGYFTTGAAKAVDACATSWPELDAKAAEMIRGRR